MKAITVKDWIEKVSAEFVADEKGSGLSNNMNGTPLRLGRDHGFPMRNHGPCRDVLPAEGSVLLGGVLDHRGDPIGGPLPDRIL